MLKCLQNSNQFRFYFDAIVSCIHFMAENVREREKEKRNIFQFDWKLFEIFWYFVRWSWRQVVIKDIFVRFYVFIEFISVISPILKFIVEHLLVVNLLSVYFFFFRFSLSLSLSRVLVLSAYLYINLMVNTRALHSHFMNFLVCVCVYLHEFIDENGFDFFDGGSNATMNCRRSFAIVFIRPHHAIRSPNSYTTWYNRMHTMTWCGRLDSR